MGQSSITWVCYAQCGGNAVSAQIGRWHSRNVGLEWVKGLPDKSDLVIYSPRLAVNIHAERFPEGPPAVGTSYTGC